MRGGDIEVDDLKLPPCMRQAVHRCRTEKSKIDVFWQMLSLDALRDATFDVSKVSELRRDLLVGKVTAIVRAGEASVAKDLVVLLEPAFREASDLVKDIADEVEALATVCSHGLNAFIGCVDRLRFAFCMCAFAFSAFCGVGVCVLIVC